MVFDGPTSITASVSRGEPIRHSFAFQNTGAAELRLSLRTGCACLATLATSSRIAPGERSSIKVDLDTRALPEGHESPVVVLVGTNELTNRSIELKIFPFVTSEVIASERSLDFGSGPANEKAIHKVTISLAPDSQIVLLDVRSTDASLAVRATRQVGIPRTYLLVVTRKATAAEGPHFGNIVVHTSSRWYPELRIPTQGVVEAMADGYPRER